MEDAVIAGQLKDFGEQLDANTAAVRAMEREVGELQGSLGVVEDHASRLGRLENGRLALLTITVAIAGAVGSAAAIIAMVIGLGAGAVP